MDQITNPLVFFAVAAVVVGYVLYMMIQKRRPERSGPTRDEPEL